MTPKTATVRHSMTEGKKFSRESSIYVIGEFLSKSLIFFLLPVYGSYLSLEDFAVLSVVMIVWPVILIFLGKGFAGYMLRGYYEYGDKKRFFGTVLLISMMVALLVAAGIHASGPWLCRLIFKNLSYKPYLQYGVIIALFRLFFLNVISFYKAKRSPFTVVVLSVAFFFSHAIAVLVSIFALDAGLRGILNAQVMAYAAVSLVTVIKILPEISMKCDLRLLRPSLSFVLPLLPHSISIWTVTFISGIFVERALTLADLSVYNMAIRLALIIGVINYGLNQAWSPFIYDNYARSNFRSLFVTNARKLVVFILALGATLILFSKEMLLLMGKSEYLDARMLLPILAAGYLFQLFYYIRVTLIFYHKNTKILPIISVIGGIVSVGLNITLIPLWGMLGAAAATCTAFFFTYAITHLFTLQYMRARVVDHHTLLFGIIVVMILIVSTIGVDRLALIPAFVIKIAIIVGIVRLLESLKLLNIREFVLTFFKP